MRIIYLFVITCLFLVNAKYLPDESATKVLLRRQARSADDVSDVSRSTDDVSRSADDVSLDSKSNDSNDVSNNSNNEDNDDDSFTSTDLDSFERKRVLKEQEFTRKQEEEKRKHEKKIAEELRKHEEKRIKEERKRQERLEREERKRLERIEKERLKQEEIERKKQEKLEKDERKRQKNIIKQLEKASSETEECSESKETDQSLELDDIGKIYIYEKYGLSASSTELEKKAALSVFLLEELGLNANSTKSERRQAIVNFINNNILDETETSVNFKDYLVNHLSAANIQKIKAKIENKINQLDNETALLNNITLPWVNEAQENVQEKRMFLQALQSLSNLFLKWLSGEPQSTSGTISDNFTPIVTDANPTGSVSSDSGSTTNTANTDPITIDQSSSSNVVPSFTDGSVDNPSISSSEPNTGTSSSTVDTHITTGPLNPSEGTKTDAATTTSHSVSSTATDNKQTIGSGDATTSVNIVTSSFDSTLASVTDMTQITSEGSPNNSAPINDSLNLGLPSELQISVSTTAATASKSSENIDVGKINYAPSSKNNTSGDSALVNSNTNSATVTGNEISTSSTNPTSSATIVPVSNVTETSISGTGPTVNMADTSPLGVGDVNKVSQEPPAIVNTSELNNPTISSDVVATTIRAESSLANEVTVLINNVPSEASIATASSSTNSELSSAIETSSSSTDHSISGIESSSSTKPTVAGTEPLVKTVINISGDPLLSANILDTASTDVSSSSTVLNMIDALNSNSPSSGDIVSSSSSKPTLFVDDNIAGISSETVPLSTEFNQAAVVTDSIYTSSSTAQKSATGTGSLDESKTIAESITTKVSYSNSSSSDITVSQEPQTTVNTNIVTEATKLDGPIIVTVDNVPLTNTGIKASVTDNSLLTGVPIEINTGTDPHIVVGDKLVGISSGTVPLSTESDQAAVVPDSINTSSSNAQKSVTGTGSPDVSTTVAEPVTTKVSYSDSSSPDITVSEEPQTTVNMKVVTEATKLNGTTIVVVDDAPLTNTRSKALVTEVESVTVNSALKGVPNEISTGTATHIVVGDKVVGISSETVPLNTEFNQAAVVTDAINTSGSTAEKSVTGTGSLDESTTIAESVTTKVSYSDSSSSDITVSQEPQTTVNINVVTEATKLDGTTIVVVDDVPLTNTGSKASVTEVESVTDNSALKDVPIEINTTETVIVYTERTAPRIVFIPGEPGAEIVDMQPQ